jgi:voltage-gated potassium channel
VEQYAEREMRLTNLKRIIEETDTKAGKAFDIFIQFLIVLSLISFSIETLPDLGESTKQFLTISETIIVVIFTVEYLIRLAVADRKLRFIFSFYGLIDLFAILPFYVARGIDLRSIRIFRLFRLIRAFKIFRFSKGIQRFKKAFSAVKEELVLFLVATAFLLFVAAVGIYYFENSAQPEAFKSVFHCLWWAIVTFTTVGYGDVYPITVGGKIFTLIMLIIGLGVVAVPTALIASALTKVVRDEESPKF